MKTSGLTARVLKEMKEAFFEVSPDGALVYLDPMIGALRHYRDPLSVRVNAQENRLELNHRGETLEQFFLAEGVRRACEAALGAYFTLVQTLAQRSREALAA